MLGLLIMMAPAQAQAQTYAVLHNFTGGSDGARPQATLAIDRAGNLYGTAPQLGALGYGTVFKLTRYGANFIFNPLYNFQGQYDGGAPIGPVTIAADGTLYGTTIEGGYFGGAYCSNGGCGTVFRLTPPPTTPPSPFTPWHETVLYAFQAGSDGMGPYSPQLIFDQAGNLYGTTFQGGNDFGVVFEMTPYGGGWTESVLYNGFAPGFPGENPISGVVMDSAGNLYGTTSIGGAGGDGVVYELSPTQYGWVEALLHSFDNGADGGLPYGGLVMDSAGNLYGATQTGSHGAVVYELSPSNGGWSFQVFITSPAEWAPMQPSPWTRPAISTAPPKTWAHMAPAWSSADQRQRRLDPDRSARLFRKLWILLLRRRDPRPQRQSLRHHGGWWVEWLGRGVENHAVRQRPGGRGLRLTAYPLAAVNDYWRKIAWLLKKSLS